jgi:hypothetical protein
MNYIYLLINDNQDGHKPLATFGRVRYVVYDIKEALEKAILLGLSVVRLRIFDGGEVNEMLIYTAPKI